MTTLEEKCSQAKALMSRLLEQHGPERVAVAWTGGKDSTVALDLWRGVLEAGGSHAVAPKVISIDTGLKFPEIVAFRDQWAETWCLDLTIARPEVNMTSYPFAEDTVTCCAELKIAPLQAAIGHLGIAALITGLRRDEHASRHEREVLEPRTCGESGPEYVQVNALLDFTEMDIWAYITSRGLPFCSLYAEGYRSLGCVPCTAKSVQGERSGRNQSKESRLDILKSLGYF